MRKVTVCCFLRFQTSWTRSKKSIVTVSKSCHHTNRHMEPYVRLSFFTLCQLQPVLIPPTTMDLLPYRKTSRETSIRTRFKSVASIEVTLVFRQHSSVQHSNCLLCVSFWHISCRLCMILSFVLYLLIHK